MAGTNFSSAKKPHVYDLLSRINGSFARATRNLFELEKFGIFDPEMMRVIYSQTKETQANVNFHLLQSLQEVEQKDWARFGRVRENRDKS
jgi:hypothetical protein